MRHRKHFDKLSKCFWFSLLKVAQMFVCRREEWSGIMLVSILWEVRVVFFIVSLLYFAGVCASVTINKQNEAIICNKLSCLFCPPSESHFNKVTANNPFHEQVVAYDSALNVDMLVFSSVKFFIIVFQMSCRL